MARQVGRRAAAGVIFGPPRRENRYDRTAVRAQIAAEKRIGKANHRPPSIRRGGTVAVLAAGRTRFRRIKVRVDAARESSMIPVAAPFERIPMPVVQALGVGRVAANRCGTPRTGPGSPPLYGFPWKFAGRTAHQETAPRTPAETNSLDRPFIASFSATELQRIRRLRILGDGTVLRQDRGP